MNEQEITLGMRDPSKNEYLMMPLDDLRRDINGLEATCRVIVGCPSPRLDNALMDSYHRLKFAKAALLIRGEVR